MLTQSAQTILRLDAEKLADELFDALLRQHHNNALPFSERIETGDFFRQEVIACLSQRSTRLRADNELQVREASL